MSEKCSVCLGEMQKPGEEVTRGLAWFGFAPPYPAMMCEHCTERFWCPAEEVYGCFRSKEMVEKYVESPDA